jgi:hypothetical protein
MGYWNEPRSSTFRSNTGFIRVFLIATALLPLLFLSNAASAATRRAVLVGIDRYRLATASEIQVAQPTLVRLGMIHPGEAPVRRNWERLYGSVNDVTGIYDLLVHRYGFSPGDIVTLTDEHATRQAILDSLHHVFVDEAQNGDTLVFYFSGHGSQMRNSLSADKADKMDETIVPWDANAGYWDIRDKDLARIFNEALNKNPGVLITAIFDSCHSGSIARGLPTNMRDRSELPDDRDAKDPYNAPAPETHGALILSAAQFDQAADEGDDRSTSPPTTHGVFTLAFMEALEKANSSTPALDIFRMTRAEIHALGSEYTQEPVIAGSDARLREGIFGGTSTATAKTFVTILAGSLDGNQFLIDGGYALGIRAGTVLESIPTVASQTPIKLTVQSVDGMSQAAVKANDPTDVAKIHKGDVYTVAQWAFPAGAKIRVWIPPNNLSVGDITRAANEFAQIARDQRVAWLTDPTDTTPTQVIDWNGKFWELRAADHVVNLGSQPNSSSVLDALQDGRLPAKARILLYLPPSRDLIAKLAVGARSENDAIEVTPDQSAAQYWLVGTELGGVIRYTWVQPNAVRASSSANALTVRGDWLTADKDTLDRVAQELTAQITTIAKDAAWMNLSAPPDAQDYPYHLELRNTSTLKTITGTDLGPAVGNMTAHAQRLRMDQVKEGESYDVILKADPNAFSSYVPTRKAYVFAIDSEGQSILLFPTGDADDQTNRLPPDVKPPDGCTPADTSALAAQSPYAEVCVNTVNITPPEGVDTYFLLTTDQPISDLAIFKGQPARSDETRGDNPLADLLSQIDSNRKIRGGADPENWSIEHISVLSVPAEQKANSTTPSN